ncbi:hypothetical protein QJS10_CPA06g01216 [Acorus calamus]|uniref:Uncharacterized protein n=1 Tax=Acorus calamus TaxID=4465 RepID=A0AAV9ELP5_ACOCL|nr:hypothetical protein QJS10_CPA06g01216 [Acorus calamus]
MQIRTFGDGKWKADEGDLLCSTTGIPRVVRPKITATSDATLLSSKGRDIKKNPKWGILDNLDMEGPFT